MKPFKPVSFEAKFVDRSGSRSKDISWCLDCHTLDKSLGNSSTASPVHCKIDNTNVHLPEELGKWIYVVLAFNYSLIRFLFVPVSLMQ